MINAGSAAPAPRTSTLPPSAAATLTTAPAPLLHAPDSFAGQVHDEVIDLTQRLVRVNSGPERLVEGENETVDLMQAYASSAGLETERHETAHGKPLLIVTLPGRDPKAPSIGFVHHSDVVGTEGTWTLGEPFSGALVNDERGREVLVGRGSVDTKGPVAQVLVALKQLKAEGVQLERSVKLFIFPDEETGSREGAWLVAREHPELIRGVGSWIVEGSGILSKEALADFHPKGDAAYLAVAQKYTIPLQVEMKAPQPAGQALQSTRDALARLDSFILHRPWSCLGSRPETAASFARMGEMLGGFKGWVVKHFYNLPLVQRMMGSAIAAANRTDLSKTDLYTTSNPSIISADPNVKPSSATLRLSLAVTESERAQALAAMRKALGDGLELKVVEPAGPDTLALELVLPQSSYHGESHGSIPDRQHDAIDVVLRGYQHEQQALAARGWADKLQMVDAYTSKSGSPGSLAAPHDLATRLTLDLRVAVDDDPQAILQGVQSALGPDFSVHQLPGQEQELDAHVRRLSHTSPLFVAAEQALKATYGATTPVLFGNTTSSNDVRFLMQATPSSEALTFVPVLYTGHGAHAPDECLTVDSLVKGVDFQVEFLKHLAGKPSAPSISP